MPEGALAAFTVWSISLFCRSSRVYWRQKV